MAIKARGREKELLKTIIQLQSMIGAARYQYSFDKSRLAYEKGHAILTKALALCVKIGSSYEYDSDIWE